MTATFNFLSSLPIAKLSSDESSTAAPADAVYWRNFFLDKSLIFLVLVFIKILNQDNLDYFAVCYRPATCLSSQARHNKDNFNHMNKLLTTTFIFIFSFYYIKAQQQYYTEENGKITLTQRGASHLASLPLKCLDKEFPFKPWYVISDTTFSSPKKLHPAFCGCFDWHSSVHGH
jgi:hypothetical protein